MDCRLASRWRSNLTGLVRTLIVLASTSECGCSTARIHEVHEGAGAIVVKVHGPPWGLVPDADLHIQDSTGHVTRSGRTNSCGVVVFEPLPEGTYSVRVGVEGADDAAAERVPVMHGADSWVEMKVKRASVESTARSKVSNCTPPQKLSGPDPMYTGTALTQRVQGCLVASCVITSAGTVRDCRVLEPLANEEMTESVIAALEHRQYTPMKCDGKPVDSDYTYRISFRLPR